MTTSIEGVLATEVVTFAGLIDGSTYVSRLSEPLAVIVNGPAGTSTIGTISGQTITFNGPAAASTAQAVIFGRL